MRTNNLHFYTVESYKIIDIQRNVFIHFACYEHTPIVACQKQQCHRITTAGFVKKIRAMVGRDQTAPRLAKTASSPRRCCPPLIYLINKWNVFRWTNANNVRRAVMSTWLSPRRFDAPLQPSLLLQWQTLTLTRKWPVRSLHHRPSAGPTSPRMAHCRM